MYVCMYMYVCVHTITTISIFLLLFYFGAYSLNYVLPTFRESAHNFAEWVRRVRTWKSIWIKREFNKQTVKKNQQKEKSPHQFRLYCVFIVMNRQENMKGYTTTRTYLHTYINMHTYMYIHKCSCIPYFFFFCFFFLFFVFFFLYRRIYNTKITGVNANLFCCFLWRMKYFFQCINLVKDYVFHGFKSIRLEFDICQTKSWNQFVFLFSLKPDIDENGSLSYHTTHKNDRSLLQKWWFCHSHVLCFRRRLWFP